MRLFAGLESLLTGLPVGGAEAAGLQRLKDAQSLIHGTTHIQAVDGGILENAVRVDNEQAAKSDTFAVDEDAVIGGDLVGHVGNNSELDAFDTVILARGSQPGAMRIDRVRGSSDNLGSQFLKLFVAVGKRGDFGGADESEVQRRPEENDPFALVIAQCGTGNRTGGSIRSIGDRGGKGRGGLPYFGETHRFGIPDIF